MCVCGWEVFEVEDGCYDVEGIVVVLFRVKVSIEKLIFINVYMIIGIGSKVVGDVKVYGVVFGVDDV